MHIAGRFVDEGCGGGEVSVKGGLGGIVRGGEMGGR